MGWLACTTIIISAGRPGSRRAYGEADMSVRATWLMIC